MEKCNLNFQPAVSKRNKTRMLTIATNPLLLPSFQSFHSVTWS